MTKKPAPRKPKLRPPVFDRGEWPTDRGDEPPPTQACWSCVFWKRKLHHPEAEDWMEGLCMRYPPPWAVHQMEDSSHDEMATNDRLRSVSWFRDWCGEWKER